MATEQRLIDAYAFGIFLMGRMGFNPANAEMVSQWMDEFIKKNTVDAVPMDDMKEFAKDVVHQFGYYGQYNGRLHIGHGGLSTLEWAFDILGWDNPHPAPEFECEIDGCHEHATCGAPTSDGYKRMCSKHYRERITDNENNS